MVVVFHSVKLSNRLIDFVYQDSDGHFHAFQATLADTHSANVDDIATLEQMVGGHRRLLCTSWFTMSRFDEFVTMPVDPRGGGSEVLRISRFDCKSEDRRSDLETDLTIPLLNLPRSRQPTEPTPYSSQQHFIDLQSSALVFASEADARPEQITRSVDLEEKWRRLALISEPLEERRKRGTVAAAAAGGRATTTGSKRMLPFPTPRHGLPLSC
jgi:hypothetical protein